MSYDMELLVEATKASMPPTITLADSYGKFLGSYGRLVQGANEYARREAVISAEIALVQIELLDCFFDVLLVIAVVMFLIAIVASI